MNPTIFVDLRCLQDPNYRARGIGQHVAALLRARANSAFANWKTIGLVDPFSPKLPDECACWVDEVTGSVNPPVNGAPAVFIDGTPMTHDTRFSLRLLNHPAFLTAAVVYDFIPLDWPGYLPTVARRIDYLAKLARLQKFDVFFPISEYTAWRTSELVGVQRDRMYVTGAAVRRSLYKLRDQIASGKLADRNRDPYFLIVSANDSRKNPDVVVKAVRMLNLLTGRRVVLKITGHFEGAFWGHGSYGETYRTQLLRLAGCREDDSFLDFHPDVSDEQLVSLFSGAIATIAPSHIEGFSLPIVEAAVCGCPAVASTCAAQMELVEQVEALFSPDDSIALAEKLQALLDSPSLRDSLLVSQSHLGPKFHEEAVGKRFWGGIQTAVEARRRAPAYVGRQRPSFAFLSPYPPDESGVARHTAFTMRVNESLFSSDLYTDSARPLTFEGSFQDAGVVTRAPFFNGRYNAVISVLANSQPHRPILELFERYGGPCLLHDAHLTNFYFHRLGAERFLEFAGRLLGRPVSLGEAHAWMTDQEQPSLFIESILERASPLIVDTATQQRLLRERYGVVAHVATTCPNIVFDNAELTQSAKRAARERLGIPSDVFAVSSFGTPGPERCMDTCLFATEILLGWGIPIEVYFVGRAENDQVREMKRIASVCNMTQRVHHFPDFVDDRTYRDFLLASDAALQLRNYSFGRFSDTLGECISAMLPSVATADMAESADAPSYVLTVPNRLSPLLVAEQLALIRESQSVGASHADERLAYLATHNFGYYGKRLTEILGFA